MRYLNNFLTFNEGLIKSVSYEKAIEILKRNIPDCKVITVQFENTHLIKIRFKNLTDAKQFIPLLNTLGYFITNKNLKEKVDSITIEPYFYEEPLQEVPKVLYHVTANIYLDKIFKQGLVPKTQSKKDIHPSRIYLTPDLYFAKWFKQNFPIFSKHKDFTILEIDTTGLNLKLYKDPQSQWRGFYTTNNISPSHIKVHKN
jgi:hypothetical protein